MFDAANTRSPPPKKTPQQQQQQHNTKKKKKKKTAVRKQEVSIQECSAERIKRLNAWWLVLEAVGH